MFESRVNRQQQTKHNTSNLLSIKQLPISLNFLVRAISGLILAPIVVYSIYQGTTLFALMIFIMALFSTLESSMMATGRRWKPSVIASLLTVPVMLFLIAFGDLQLWFIGMLLCISLLIVASRLPSTRLSGKQIVMMIVLQIYIVHSLGFGLLIREHPLGLMLWILVIAGAWVSDTLAYAGGRFYGRTPLVPKFSPNKTVEGALTGILGAIIISTIILAMSHAIIPQIMVIVILAPFAAIIGDLTISLVKRYYEVKDSGVPGLNIVPGHGGLLDRIDSLMMVLFWVYPIVLFIVP